MSQLRNSLVKNLKRVSLSLHILLINLLMQWFAWGRLSVFHSMVIQKSEAKRIHNASRKKKKRKKNIMAS